MYISFVSEDVGFFGNRQGVIGLRIACMSLVCEVSPIWIVCIPEKDEGECGLVEEALLCLEAVFVHWVAHNCIIFLCKLQVGVIFLMSV